MFLNKHTARGDISADFPIDGIVEILMKKKLTPNILSLDEIELFSLETAISCTRPHTCHGDHCLKDDIKSNYC